VCSIHSAIELYSAVMGIVNKWTLLDAGDGFEGAPLLVQSFGLPARCARPNR
jgi:hypothetical protein